MHKNVQCIKFTLNNISCREDIDAVSGELL